MVWRGVLVVLKRTTSLPGTVNSATRNATKPLHVVRSEAATPFTLTHKEFTRQHQSLLRLRSG